MARIRRTLLEPAAAAVLPGSNQSLLRQMRATRGASPPIILCSFNCSRSAIGPRTYLRSTKQIRPVFVALCMYSIVYESVRAELSKRDDAPHKNKRLF